ncbi:UNVERIFIED_CONTAM: hypothetical protein PYX00_011326 [Menopon gallinae]|uniref:Uncharacterized protein n=1 Tax=Menopon gallinae TaxID=328185 RepID=A0AAW2H798_9NEOP
MQHVCIKTAQKAAYMKKTILIEYISSNRLRIYNEASADELSTLEHAAKKVKDGGAHDVIFIAPFYVDKQECREHISKILQLASVQSARIARPSLLCTCTFEKESIFYININIADKDDIYTVDCGSVINEASCKIEVEEIKKAVMADEHNVECYVEVVRDRAVYPDLCCRFEDHVDTVVNKIYNILKANTGGEGLATNIYIDSRSAQLKATFKNKFAMSMCMSEGDSLSKATFLEVPDFVKDISFVWKTVDESAVLVGALKAMKECKAAEDLFLCCET